MKKVNYIKRNNTSKKAYKMSRHVLGEEGKRVYLAIYSKEFIQYIEKELFDNVSIPPIESLSAKEIANLNFIAKFFNYDLDKVKRAVYEFLGTLILFSTLLAEYGLINGFRIWIGMGRPQSFEDYHKNRGKR